MTERRRRSLGAPALVAALMVAGCATSSPSQTPTDSAGASSAASPGTSAGLIPQPSVGEIEVADPAARVDLVVPTFSNPTLITNPLFPVELGSANLLVGTVEDQAFRTEVTVLPTTRVLEWAGQRVETVVSQYAAFLDGRIHEIAYDLYAQADDGSVWYFGEDVFNFADGAIVDTHGTWHAGTDGPAAMIMPADPAEGDVYRPENIPGLVFEEVVVQSTGVTVDGPFGPIDGAIVVEEHHMDGAIEEKTFAPGYGEFYTAAGGDVEALALSLPADAASGSEPDALATLTAGAADAVQAALDDDLSAVAGLADDLESARADLGDAEIPALIQPVLTDAIEALAGAADAGDAAAATEAAIGAARIAGDLAMRYRPIPEVDLARIGLWGAQLIVDAGAEDLDAVHATNFALSYTRERMVAGVPADVLTELNAILEELQGAVDDEDFGAMLEIGEQLRTLAG